MKEIRLLIVDDVEDNRLVLHAICHKMEGFVIREAVDGVDAVQQVAAWQPHIVLMDIMMPHMDGFEASKIIKKAFPATIVMAVTAVMDPQMEANMAAIGVAAYVHKPIDKALVRFKLQNFAMLVRAKVGEHFPLSAKSVVNPFCSDVRHFKTVFDISTPDAMMDFGMWILTRCDTHRALSCPKVDEMMEFFYELMRQASHRQEALEIVIEESFEEIFVTMRSMQPITLNATLEPLAQGLKPHIALSDFTASVRLAFTPIVEEEAPQSVTVQAPQIIAPIETPAATPPALKHTAVSHPPAQAPDTTEKRRLDEKAQTMLRQSFVQKTNAVDYVSDIGGDVLDEIRDLESLDQEWAERLAALEREPTEANLLAFVDQVFAVYVRAINGLFEFTALAYALSSLGSFLREHATQIVSDEAKLKKLIMLIEFLGNDLTTWREHIFVLQDTEDIHYLDSSFFSSCMQIEGIIGTQAVAAEDDHDLELF